MGKRQRGVPLPPGPNPVYLPLNQRWIAEFNQKRASAPRPGVHYYMPGTDYRANDFTIFGFNAFADTWQDRTVTYEAPGAVRTARYNGGITGQAGQSGPEDPPPPPPPGPPPPRRPAGGGGQGGGDDGDDDGTPPDIRPPRQPETPSAPRPLGPETPSAPRPLGPDRTRSDATSIPANQPGPSATLSQKLEATMDALLKELRTTRGLTVQLGDSGVPTDNDEAANVLREQAAEMEADLRAQLERAAQQMREERLREQTEAAKASVANQARISASEARIAILKEKLEQSDKERARAEDEVNAYVEHADNLRRMHANELRDVMRDSEREVKALDAKMRALEAKLAGQRQADKDAAEAGKRKADKDAAEAGKRKADKDADKDAAAEKRKAAGLRRAEDKRRRARNLTMSAEDVEMAATVVEMSREEAYSMAPDEKHRRMLKLRLSTETQEYAQLQALDERMAIAMERASQARAESDRRNAARAGPSVDMRQAAEKRKRAAGGAEPQSKRGRIDPVEAIRQEAVQLGRNVAIQQEAIRVGQEAAEDEANQAVGLAQMETVMAAREIARQMEAEVRREEHERIAAEVEREQEALLMARGDPVDPAQLRPDGVGMQPSQAVPYAPVVDGIRIANINALGAEDVRRMAIETGRAVASEMAAQAFMDSLGPGRSADEEFMDSLGNAPPDQSQAAAGDFLARLGGPDDVRARMNNRFTGPSAPDPYRFSNPPRRQR